MKMRNVKAATQGILSSNYRILPVFSAVFVILIAVSTKTPYYDTFLLHGPSFNNPTFYSICGKYILNI